MQDTYVLETRAEVNALSDPDRVRLLELLGRDNWQLTVPELASQSGLSPRNVGVMVRRLVKAGLVEETTETGCFRAIARNFVVHPKFRGSAGASALQAALLAQTQRAHAEHSRAGTFTCAQLEVRLTLERARELMGTFLAAARDVEDPGAERVVLTVFVHPPSAA